MYICIYSVKCIPQYIYTSYNSYILYFFPLVLIECKATQVNQKAIRQVLGYNYFLKACFVALASPQSLQYGWLDSHQKFHLKSGFPSYLMLLEKAKILDLY